MGIDGARPTKRTGTFNVETTGTYVLTYSASDKSGNTIGKGNCKHTTRRTIVVKDTLKPVISLHFGGKKIHQSASADKGVNGQANMAGQANYNPYFMEETQTSVNGWVMGAIASAVTGVALLGYSMKKTLSPPPSQSKWVRSRFFVRMCCMLRGTHLRGDSG